MTKHAQDTKGLEGLEKMQPHFTHGSFEKTIAINLSLNITEVNA